MEFFVIMDDPVLEYDVSCGFPSEGEEGEIFVELGFGEAHEFVLLLVVVALPNNGFECVENVLMTK